MQSNSEIKFGTDGWRAVIGQDYTFENLKIVSQAVADYLGSGKSIAVGFDTRFMSDRFAEVVCAVFRNNGIEVILSDRAIPTPALSFTVKNRRLDLGIMITASHNPPEYNGFKIKNSSGGAAGPQVTRDIESRLGKTPIKEIDAGLAKITKGDLVTEYVKFIRSFIDLKRIKRGEEMTWLLENNIIFTIGYEGFSIEDFIKKLKDSNIQQLIDVRELALSRKNGFSKGILSLKLKEAGILYKHIPELGSPKEIRHQLHQDWDYKRFFEEYKNHIKDIDVLGNISDIEGRAKRKKTVLLCFEKDPKTCHRSIIAEELVKRGWRINNL